VAAVAAVHLLKVTLVVAAAVVVVGVQVPQLVAAAQQDKAAMVAMVFHKVVPLLVAVVAEQLPMVVADPLVQLVPVVLAVPLAI
jgi:flagellar biosynthesis protein FlhB